MSNKATVTCGVLQGSSFGPLLFLLYVNAINQCSNKFRFYPFAGDTNILYADENLKTLEGKVNAELPKLSDRLIANQLNLNIQKSNFILFHPHQKRAAYSPNYIYLIARKVAMQDLNQKINLTILAFYLINIFRGNSISILFPLNLVKLLA